MLKMLLVVSNTAVSLLRTANAQIPEQNVKQVLSH